jgi:hypothetical protein
MKEIDYRNTLAVASLIELLLEKGVLARDELAAKVRELDSLAEQEARLLSLRRAAPVGAPGGQGRRAGAPHPGGTPAADLDPQ